jgi:hypothetical protein
LSRPGIGHAGEVLAGRHPLAHVDRHLLQYAGEARRHLQRTEAAGVEIGDGLRLIDRGLLHAKRASIDSRAAVRRRVSMATRFFSVSALSCDCL